ncbi:MAG: hypothetical protein KIT33_09800 [Candidatus Kapabacteria bacterium]|nr:hypothetical protein [Ignavibacteriota bacterium]MCW5885250.1 hypothetical protein [Candidatus Kapabacteria bacterium]
MKHTFKIPRRNAKGVIIRDEDDNQIFDEFVYDFELMGADRMLAGRKLFHISNQEFANRPAQSDELGSLVARQAERQGFAAILMRKIDENLFEFYNEQTANAFDALKDIQGSENFIKLMECQDHFFGKVGLQKPELMTQSLDIMMQSVNILKTIEQLKEAGGLELTQLTEMILGKNTEQLTGGKKEKDSTI